jgi:hypothetical protein
LIASEALHPDCQSSSVQRLQLGSIGDDLNASCGKLSDP